MEFFAIKSIVGELREKICGARVLDAFKPSRYALSLRLKSPDGAENLIISVDAESPRIHLTDRPDGEKTPISISFKKHLTGAIIDRIEIKGFDRIVELRVSKSAAGGLESKEYALLIELMGRSSNSMLVESKTGLILECLRRVDAKKSRIRRILPGAKYSPPPAHGKMDPAAVTPEALGELLETATCADEFSKKAVAAYRGLGPQGSKEIYWRWRGLPEGRPDIGAAWDAFLIVTGLNSPRSPEPIFYFDPEIDLPIYLSPIAVKSLGHLPSKRYRTMNEAADAFFSWRARVLGFQCRKRRLLSRIAIALEKVKSKRGAILSDIEKMRLAEGEKVKADLIMANLNELRKGMGPALLRPFGDCEAEPVLIELDPSLSPVENATLLYKKYSKAKRGLMTVQERLQSAERTMAEVESLLKRATSAKNEDELDSAEESLVGKEIIKQPGPPPKKEKTKGGASLHGIKSFFSSDGCDIFVGRSDKANDYLLARFTGGNDIWLHAEGVSGAHVVLKAKGKKTPHSALAVKEAALLAAHFSKARESATAPVNYAAGKYVKKLKGAGPGRVILHNHKTIFVRLDSEGIAQIMKRRKQS